MLPIAPGVAKWDIILLEKEVWHLVFHWSIRVLREFISEGKKELV
jgi:hypothetical protein